MFYPVSIARKGKHRRTSQSAFHGENWFAGHPRGSIEAWVGHPLDPIGCLLDTLLDASTIQDGRSSDGGPNSSGMIVVALRTFKTCKRKPGFSTPIET